MPSRNWVNREELICVIFFFEGGGLRGSTPDGGFDLPKFQERRAAPLGLFYLNSDLCSFSPTVAFGNTLFQSAFTEGD